MPNFESSWPVAILSWVSGGCPGVDPQQHPLGAPGGDPLEPVDLVERVDDHVADAGLDGRSSSAALLLLPCM